MYYKVKCKKDELQAFPFADAFNKYVKQKAVQAIVESEQVNDLLASLQPKLINILEVTSILTISLVKSRDWQDVLVAVVSAYKMITGGNIIMAVSEWSEKVSKFLIKLFPNCVVFEGEASLQSGWADKLEEVSGVLRTALVDYKSVLQSPILKKLQSLFRYVLSFGLLESFGINFEKCFYSEVEAHYVSKNHSNIHDFILTIFDSVTFMVQRCIQAYKLKSFMPFYHSEATYTAWALKAQRLEEDSHKLYGAAETRVDEFKFVADLKDTIEQGEAIVKYAAEGKERLTLTGLLRSLRLIQASVLTKQAARASRESPFAVLVSGDSSIGKSKFQELLFQQFGKNFDLPIDSHFKYTRVAADKFFSGFDTSCWCIVIDDIALLKPDKNPMDPSLGEVIQIVNTVTYNPPMADIDEKGRNPLRCALVIGTTNQEDLNAHAYFACPLAVLRRMKYVVELEVKPEYAQEESPTMLDAAKAAASNEEWPNYWNITLKQVVSVPDPSNTKRRKPAYKELFKFEGDDAIYDFMSVLMTIARESRKYANCDTMNTLAMSKVANCRKCYRPETRCRCTPQVETELEALQTEPLAEYYSSQEEDYDSICNDTNWDVAMENTFSSAFSETFSEEDERWLSFNMADTMAFAKVHAMGISLSTQHLVSKARDNIVNSWCYQEASCFITDMARIGKCIGERISGSLVVAFTACLGGIAAIYKMLSFFRGPIFGLQGNVLSTPAPVLEKEMDEPKSRSIGKAPIVKGDEGENVWITQDMNLHKFDMGEMSVSWKGLDWNTIQTKVLANTSHIVNRYVVGEDILRTDVNAFCVAGHIYVTNNHAFPPCESNTYNIELIDEPVAQGVTSNMKAIIRESEIFRVPSKDLCFLRLCTSVKKDLRNLFPKKDMPGIVANGSILGRNCNGLPAVRSISRLSFEEYFPPTLMRMASWYGKPSEATKLGDCGSVYVANVEAGPMILGIHQSLVANGAHCTTVTHREIDEAIAWFGEVIVNRGKPQSAITKLTELHHKSPLRFFEEGTAKVYGSVSQGFRVQPKTKVRPLIISEAAQKLGYALRHGAPVMKGWEPKRKGIEHTLNIEQKLDQSVLRLCTESFANEVTSRLDPEWKDELHILDDISTINGVPGLKFIDKMKRNTSMGYPWRKPKSYFMEHIEDETRPDAVDFVPEVYEEIDRIIDCYSRGERAHPVFTSCLKDEALPFKKIADKKTRVFSIGNAPHGMVMRKYLLTFVRVFQKNSLIFEGAPGINCGSASWDTLYEYLTTFGPHREIAGDYGKFDKHMEPSIILSAFDFICKILKWAGWSDSDILIVKCIGEDIAYALTEYFGDVVEFMGSNPSGQVLTVIINCIVNSLYMRYCMYCCAPVDKENYVRNFKTYVKLITYGDDNAMNVSPECDFFNHTALQKVLAAVSVEYTMADKEAESVPFINIKDVSFLKRTWRWEPLLGKHGGWACPIEFASIEKMLNINTKSDFVCREEQAIMAIRSAVNEFFYYGKDFFDEHCANMHKIIAECGLEDYVNPSTFPTWEELLERWNNGSSTLSLDASEDGSEE